MRRAGLAAAALILVDLLRGQPAAAEDEDLVDALARARTREAIVAERSENTEARARAQALAAYRLARKRAATFLADPSGRSQQARALDAALWVLAREASEAALLRVELDRSVRDREALQAAVGPAHARPATPTVSQPHPTWTPLLWPARGSLVGAPGLRRDDATLALRREEGVRILSRLNAVARAPAPGRVHRIAPLPQGGFALVTVNDDGSVGILSGLRQVDVTVGAALDRGQRVGLVGRDLDGAPVITFELWHRGRPLDPAPRLSLDN